MPIRAITLDLDDTLWPILPTLRRAEAVLREHLLREAPATAALHDAASMREIRAQVLLDHPAMAHDLGAIRRECLTRALRAAGDDPALAGPAFDVFYEARQQVTLYADARPALERLAARWPLVALSNGNADIARVGLAAYFQGAVSAREVGVAKPAAKAFEAACRVAGHPPSHVLHVGDDGPADIDGALAAGMQAAWVCRPGHEGMPTPQRIPHWQVTNLTELADRLGV